MSFYDTVDTSKHSVGYYITRDLVRVVFWSTLILVPLWALLVVVA
jgi:hypothetical protein